MFEWMEYRNTLDKDSSVEYKQEEDRHEIIVSKID